MRSSYAPGLQVAKRVVILWMAEFNSANELPPCPSKLTQRGSHILRQFIFQNLEGTPRFGGD